MQAKYKNKIWLYNQYSRRKASTHKIAKLCEVNPATIWFWMIKFNISLRSRSEATHLRQANHCQLTQKSKEWIDGELLGDGGLQSYSSYSAYFDYSSKYQEYINYVSNILKSFGIKQSGKICKQFHEDMNCYSYHYRSHAYVELLYIYKRWYPQGKKIIPQNLKLTPLVLRQEYIGDGYLQKDISIVLFTNGFPVSDVEWFVNELKKLGFKASRQPSHNSIHISVYSTLGFLYYIGKCPVDCYKYKWDIKK